MRSHRYAEKWTAVFQIVKWGTNKIFTARHSLAVIPFLAALSFSHPDAVAQQERAPEKLHTLHGSQATAQARDLKSSLAPSDGGEINRGFARLFSIQSPINSPFGKLIGLKPQASPVYDLRILGLQMFEPEGFENDSAGDSEMPAGYTFLGQFIDHDITLDTITRLSDRVRISDVENARSVELDLDCVYAGGPERNSELYNLPWLRAGEETANGRHDLLRTPPASGSGPQGGGSRAIIGDPRNDENFIVSQMQAAFIAFHNSMVEKLLEKRGFASADDLSASQRLEIFDSARDHTIHYYHRVIAEDFLPRLIGIERAIDILGSGREFYFPKGFILADESLAEPFIPVEFSVAAYRYGHSQVRQNYQLREDLNLPLFKIEADGTMRSIFGFRPIRTADENRTVDWRYFFPIGGVAADDFNFARVIDPQLPVHLKNLEMVGVVGDDDVGSLASRNLNRGRVFRLPSGQSVAREVLAKLGERELSGGVPLISLWEVPVGGSRRPARHPEELLIEPDYLVRKTLASLETPLWYYVLQESREFGYRTITRSPAMRLVDVDETDSATRETVEETTVETDVGTEQRTAYFKLERSSVDQAIIDAEKDEQPVYVELQESLKADFNKAPPSADFIGTRRSEGALTGHTLGPVGGTLVGEVLYGLIDHYRDKTGEGLDFIPEVNLQSQQQVVLGINYGNRYLMSDFLRDAKVDSKPEIED